MTHKCLKRMCLYLRTVRMHCSIPYMNERRI